MKTMSQSEYSRLFADMGLLHLRMKSQSECRIRGMRYTVTRGCRFASLCLVSIQSVSLTKSRAGGDAGVT